MDEKKVLEVIQTYRKYFNENNIPKGKAPYDVPHDEALVFSFNEDDIIMHCHGMLDQMEEFVKEGRMDKVFRWLGFIQGCLWSCGEYTLDELKNHNRSDR